MRVIATVYLGSYFLSLLGNSIAAIALPLIVLQTTGSVLGAGAVAGATALPAVLAGLFMGVVIDRINRRTSSVITDVVSALAIAALPVVDVVSGLSLGWFILFGVVGAVGDVPGMTARETLLPAIVRHSGIPAERLMGLRESLGAVAIIVGPAAAGGLMTVFEGSTVLWITAATSFAAALVTLALPRHVGEIVGDDGAPAVVTGSSWSQLRDGWRLLFRRSRFLLTVTLVSTVLVILMGALQGLILPVHFTIAGEPGYLGLVLSAIAAGTLVGGGIYAGAGGRGPRRAWFLTGLAGTVAGFALIGVLPASWVMFTGGFVVGLSSGMMSGLLGVLMIERIPERMRGRVMGTQNSIATVAAPFGIVAAAVLTHLFDLVVVASSLVAVWAIVAVVSAVVPSLRDLERDRPSTPREAGDAGH